MDVLHFLLYVGGIVGSFFLIGCFFHRCDKKSKEKRNKTEINSAGYDKLAEMCREFFQLPEMANEFLAENNKSLNDENVVINLGEFKEIEKMFYKLREERNKQNAKDRLRMISSGEIPPPEPQSQEPDEERNENGNRFHSLEM